MVQLQDRPTVRRDRTRRSGQVGEYMTGAFALLVAALGAWLYWGGSDGVLQVFAWEWNVSDIHSGWGLGLMILGAVLAAVYTALVTTRKTR
ncbi:MAG: hypothetical protein OEM97_02910 [Acidimicrobiia bacterium]|nr:hypothetical protein [Acidimicrobiia bacterium]